MEGAHLFQTVYLGFEVRWESQPILKSPVLVRNSTVFLYLGKFYFVFFPPTVKYLGLLAMSKILKTHPKSVQSHKDLILQCLDDKDESIRLRALDLLYGMVCLDVFSSS